jgi:hypothetical protein
VGQGQWAGETCGRRNILHDNDVCSACMEQSVHASCEHQNRTTQDTVLLLWATDQQSSSWDAYIPTANGVIPYLSFTRAISTLQSSRT